MINLTGLFISNHGSGSGVKDDGYLDVANEGMMGVGGGSSDITQDDWPGV